MEETQAPLADGAAVASRQTGAGIVPGVSTRPVAYQAVLGSLALAGALVFAALAAKYVLFLLTSGNAGYIIYIPAVAVAAWYRGLWVGVVTLVAGAAADYLLFDVGRLMPAALPDEELRL